MQKLKLYILSEALRNGKIKETAYSSHNNFKFPNFTFTINDINTYPNKEFSLYFNRAIGVS